MIKCVCLATFCRSKRIDMRRYPYVFIRLSIIIYVFGGFVDVKNPSFNQIW